MIPRIDRTIRYLEKRKRNTEKARDMALSEEHQFTAYLFEDMLYRFQFDIGELVMKKAHLKPQCDNPIEELEDYFGEFAAGGEL